MSTEPGLRKILRDRLIRWRKFSYDGVHRGATTIPCRGTNSSDPLSSKRDSSLARVSASDFSFRRVVDGGAQGVAGLREPMVRIHFPPAESLRTIGSSAARTPSKSSPVSLLPERKRPHRNNCQLAPSTRVMAWRKPSWASREHQLDALEPALDQVLQESRPERLGLRRADTEADDLAPTFGRSSHKQLSRRPRRCGPPSRTLR